MDRENEHQRALRLWITAGLSIQQVVDLKGDTGYLLNNMIAKYTLAADHYAVSGAAKRKLKNARPIKPKPISLGMMQPHAWEFSL